MKTKQHHTRSGFTLLELLVAVTIFSALVILSVSIFARTISSSAQADAVRQRTEVARAAVDQVTNDFHYVDNTQTPTICQGITPAPPTGSWKGYCVGQIGGYTDALFMLLKYPGQNTNVARTYFVDTEGNLLVTENRDYDAQCSSSCPDVTASPSKVLTNNYLADNATAPVFVAHANTTNSQGRLDIDLVIKQPGGDCGVAGSCYELQTSLTGGGIL